METSLNYIVRISIMGVYFDSKPMKYLDAEKEVIYIINQYPDINVCAIEVA